MQSATNAWHGGHRTSGGALKPDKCSWCLVAFYWEHGQWFYASPAFVPETLTIHFPHGDRAIVTCHDVTEAIKVVGVTQALDGSMHGQVEVLQTKADRWSQQIQEGWVPAKESCLQSSQHYDLAIPLLPSSCL
jgi:hypothetical protein